MGGQPLATATQELVDLVGSDPVVLLVVEHRQEHKDVLERAAHRVHSRAEKFSRQRGWRQALAPRAESSLALIAP